MGQPLTALHRLLVIVAAVRAERGAVGRDGKCGHVPPIKPNTAFQGRKLGTARQVPLLKGTSKVKLATEQGALDFATQPSPSLPCPSTITQLNLKTHFPCEGEHIGAETALLSGLGPTPRDLRATCILQPPALEVTGHCLISLRFSETADEQAGTRVRQVSTHLVPENSGKRISNVSLTWGGAVDQVSP